MSRLRLQDSETSSIQELLSNLARRFSSCEDPEFHELAPVYAHELPRRIRETFVRFRLHEPREGLLVVSGYPVDPEKIGATPEHWAREDVARTREESMFLVLLASLLGECIAWSTQQDGRLVHNILPIKGHEDEQLGSGSEQPLWWHTEDAFHPYRGDYLGMACLRNPTRVPTTFLSISRLPLSPRQVDLLSRPVFTIRPDNSHLAKHKSETRQVDETLATSYQEIERMKDRPDKIPVLFGDPRAPYVRLDPYFMDPVEDDREAQDALDALVAAIDENLEDLVLEPGDVCFIDNFQAVHGRKPFKARFDGTDRWLKRVNVVRDLRKSRVSRAQAASRVLA